MSDTFKGFSWSAATPPLDKSVLDASVLAPGLALKWNKTGVALFEPFGGGLCAGLTMLLRCGVRVHHYLHSDINKGARTIAMHRVKCLSAQYPDQLALEAVDHMFSLPNDVTQITEAHLINEMSKVTATDCWVVVAGWPCQDLSAAGSGTGLKGSKSRAFYDLIDILNFMQGHAKPGHMAWLLENVAMQHNHQHPSAKADYDVINSILGVPVCIDAARFGARAHRLRNFWQNVVPAEHLQTLLDTVVRPAGLYVQDIWAPGC